MDAVRQALDPFVYNDEDGNTTVNMREFIFVWMGGEHTLECPPDAAQPKRRGRPRKEGVLKRKRATSTTGDGNDCNNNENLQAVVANLQAQLLAIQQNMQNNAQNAASD